ncbi:9-O-acetylesterase [Mobiluncus mulieris]|nr:9-O-acetylesterase [Mobiluncus mulieris]PNL43553.1 9-O-acetylesterase [Mobiluncus mulieris]
MPVHEVPVSDGLFQELVGWNSQFNCGPKKGQLWKRKTANRGKIWGIHQRNNGVKERVLQSLALKKIHLRDMASGPMETNLVTKISGITDI